MTPSYWAFLSYSHRDKDWADWLHNALERYRVPAALVGRTTAQGPVPERLGAVFRDRTELAASDDLGAEIRAALAGSRFLIVLCSPAAAASRWTNEEIKTFKRLHPASRVLAAIVAGEPFASREPERAAEECFPEALRHRFDAEGRPLTEDAEPIAADLRPEGDGKRLGLLKLVAGMIGVGLDDLVQRDVQRRQTRLLWLSGGSLLGMAVASILAMTAIEARDEARDQRGKAEELIGFMLGDLKGRLEPLGRLDVLDSVGAQALSYYEGQDKGELSDRGLAQRSRALTLIGEIANRRGDLDGALRRYREALAGTEEALRRGPADPQRIFDHAQNVFWVGYIDWQRGNVAQAERQFVNYQSLSRQLLAMDPNRPEWRLENVYADTNLGTLLMERRRYRDAAATFEAALRESEALAAARPGALQFQNQLLEALANLADAQERLGLFDEAIHNRERQIRLIAHLSTGGDSAALRRKAMTAHRSLGLLFASRGEIAAALDHLRTASSAADSLIGTEPGNTDWLHLGAAISINRGDLLLASGRTAEAAAAARDGCATANRLVRRDPSVRAWRIGALAPCLLLRARLGLARGHPAEAGPALERVLAIVSSPSRASEPLRDRIAASAQLLRGDLRAAGGQRAAAVEAWQAGLVALPADASEPAALAQRVLLMERLGRDREAEPLRARLEAIGYRHPLFVAGRNST